MPEKRREFDGTLWWLEGLATLIAFIVPIGVMLSGAETSTASPLTFMIAFLAMFVTRLWGSKRLIAARSNGRPRDGTGGHGAHGYTITIHKARGCVQKMTSDEVIVMT